MSWVSESSFVPFGDIELWEDDAPLVLFAPHRDWWFLRQRIEDEYPFYPVELKPLYANIYGERIRGFEVHLMGEPLRLKTFEWIDSLRTRVIPAMESFHANGIVRGY